MRRALALSLGFLVLASGGVACSGDDPEPGFTPTGEAGAGGAAGGTGGASGGQGGGGGQGGKGQGGQGGASGQGAGGGSGQGGGAGQGAACDEDLNEPNDAALQARLVPGADGDGVMSDCDDEDSLSGLLDGPDDADWFFFAGKDDVCVEFGDNIGPHASLEVAGASAEVCIFVQPKAEAGALACDEDSEPSDELAGQGYTGCCGAAEARLTFGSSDTTDEGDVRIKVSKLSGAICGGYSLRVNYHE
jgi:hypothetical protein